jgi:hypothetical protein
MLESRFVRASVDPGQNERRCLLWPTSGPGQHQKIIISAEFPFVCEDDDDDSFPQTVCACLNSVPPRIICRNAGFMSILRMRERVHVGMLLITPFRNRSISQRLTIMRDHNRVSVTCRVSYHFTGFDKSCVKSLMIATQLAFFTSKHLTNSLSLETIRLSRAIVCGPDQQLNVQLFGSSRSR